MSSTVHLLGPWQQEADGRFVRRCTNCREVQFVRFAGSRDEWHREGDRIRVHGSGFRERTDGAVTCLKAA